MGKGPSSGHFDAHQLTIAGQDVVVITAPLLAAVIPTLTDAENDVVTRLLRGESNAQIGRSRRTSARTVANQVAAIYRKLGVSSRRELVALFT